MNKRRYGKLVRDKIPDIIRSEEKIPNTRIMDDDEFRNELLYKLIEEAEEARKTGEYDKNDKVALSEEMADILEVMYAIFKEFDLDEGDIERIRRGKLKDRGGFEKKIFLESVIDN